ncbi:hypothetical protein ACUXCC_004750 [Cytobacillus horneckiae]|uniref:MEDS domain-containing protein n=1 Tax=Cytobacillus horneckiae TaxID=549687 RepID=UPI001F150FCA|nr:MEDS domain-containing protein [Cytobacillus horneckiae]MCM3176810.1 MEDS domain-containing protein [Cytobacillus horneckiae]MEC1156652.1 MEDS domain-containing protein [Cytobacillus horneckiae]MED2939127.1 MEDS domain-containing protein [Cytobacillus horneckiae]
MSFRFWAHVEWGTIEGPLKIVEKLEQIIDDAVNEMSFPLICAYKKERMPESLQNILLKTHPYVRTEDDFIISDQYMASNKK